MSGNEGGIFGTVTPGASDPPPSSASQPSFADVVPAEYKDKPWMENFTKSDDPFGNLFKSYDSAQSMLGKRVEVPGPDASPETLKAFYKTLGVPDKPEGYEYKAPDLSKEPEQIQKAWTDHTKDSKLMDSMRQIALAEGITPKQFSTLAAALDSHNLEQLRTMVAKSSSQQETADKAQREAFSKYYGDKAETVERLAKSVAEKMIPPEVAKMGPDIALIHVLHQVHEKLYKSDSPSTTNGDPASTATSKSELHAQIMKLRSDPAYDNKMDPRHPDLFKRVMSMYEEMDKLT